MTLQKLIDLSTRIVFFGGAGVSTESGIPDFRSQDGLYNTKYDYPPEQIVSHSFYKAHGEEFFRFYREKMIFPDAKPNAAHIKLAELERAGKLSCVITQNIDGLHQMAGSKNVIELHGSIHRNYCERCRKAYPLLAITECNGIPVCDCGGRIKPDVVLYEESLNTDDLVRAGDELSQADTLIIGGTSLAVYPAAALVHQFRGDNIVVINKSPISADEYADLIIKDSIGKVLAEIEI